MSLLDAFLLDPHRINVWITYRTDGVKGSGTQNDPYDGSTAARFDQIMRDYGAANTTILLGPGTFQTEGFYEGIGSSTGWQAKAGMKVIGSGVDVTILQQADSSVPAAAVHL